MRRIVLFLALSFALGGQTFEVASVRRAPDNSPKRGFDSAITFSDDGVTMRNVTLRDIIEAAYAIEPHQLACPAWLDQEFYEIAAKAGSAAPRERIRGMLQSLLVERFHLELHHETRELSVASMTLAKDASKLGEAKPGGTSELRIESGRIVFRNFSMSRLAAYLSRVSAGRPVVDATGLDGVYDFAATLDVPAGGDLVEQKRSLEAASRDGSFATMIAQSLGLKLSAKRAPVEVLVVDRAEKTPTEN